MRHHKILIIDEDKGHVAVVKELLKTHKVVALNTPETALDFCQKEKPDLIIVEAQWPTGYEGFHFLWRLRSSAEIKNTPVILTHKLDSKIDLFTNFCDGHYQLKEFLPAELVLAKPLDYQLLQEAVEKIFQGAVWQSS